MKVFVSHTQADHQLVHVLARALHERGLEPVVAAFRPMPGSRLGDKVRLLIEGSDCVVVLNTSGASRSRWVQQEIGCAKAFGKHIVPLKTRGARLAAMLEGYEYYPITRGDAGKGLRRVAALLRRWAQDNGLKVAPETDSAGVDKFFQILHLPQALICRTATTSTTTWRPASCADSGYAIDVAEQFRLLPRQSRLVSLAREPV